MITFLGFAMMIGIIALILLRRISPVVAFATIPVAVSFLAGFTPDQTGEFIKKGLGTVAPTAALFIFAILYFGIMRDRGLFDPLVNFLIKRTHGRPLAVALVTVVVAAVAHLDGVGAATFLLTIPALLPLYQRLKMNPLMLLCLVGISAGVVNMVPWGGPTARAAAATGIDAALLWKPLIPVQVLGVALFLGLHAHRRHKATVAHGSVGAAETTVADHPYVIPRDGALPVSNWRYWANLALTVALLVVLFTGAFPLFAIFMVGLGVALFLDSPDPRRQTERIANDALQMALVMLAAGVLLGILAGTKMSDGMAHALIELLPAGAAQYLHVAIGIFGVRLGMLFSPDAYYFALLPIVRDVAVAAGVPVEAVARAMLIGENTGFCVSPVVPSVYLAIGLAGVELRSHIKYTFFWAWGVSLVLLLFAVIIGVVAV